MLSRREIAVIMISLSMMAGFVTGVIIWNTFRSYEVELSNKVKYGLIVHGSNYEK